MRVGRALVVVAAGIAVGSLTSVGQTYLDQPLNAFVNSASAWLVVPFAAGAWMATRRGAALAGLSVALAQLVGYYATAHARGYATGTSILAFWTACALVGGPVFGTAGQLWRRERQGSLRGLGMSILAAAFFAEGLWVYLHELHYYDTAALWIGIGALIVVALARGFKDLRWLALTVPAGLLAEVLLVLVYSQAA